MAIVNSKTLYESKSKIATVVSFVLVLASFAVWGFGTNSALLLLVAILLSVIVGFVVYLAMANLRREPLDAFDLLFQLARDEPVSQLQTQITRSLVDASKRGDTVFRELLVNRLNSICDDVHQIGKGRIEFRNTESWRIFYEQILRSPSTTMYRSVAHIETENYWQDGAGRKSTDLNLELHDSGKVNIERIAIVADHLWPTDQPFPTKSIHHWLDEQHRHGIWVEVVRESELLGEPQLIADFGIYGFRALGRQVSDIAGRTSRFTLSFDYEDVKQGDRYWDKLRVFSTSYSKLLDRAH